MWLGFAALINFLKMGDDFIGPAEAVPLFTRPFVGFVRSHPFNKEL